MDIPIKNEEATENSLHDAYFLYNSQLLLPKKSITTSNKYRMGYKKSFEPIISNRILKKTLNTSWTERYFTLTSTRLLYYHDQTMKQLKGCFILASLIQYRLQVKQKYPHIQLIVDMKGQSGDDKELPSDEKVLLQLMIEDNDTFNQWFQELTKVVTKLSSLKIEDIRLFPQIKKDSILQTNTKLGNSPGNFWNNFVISTSQLMKYASHLDIILLRSKNPIFYLHRFFMRSYYDHVAILIKDETEKIFLFEAIQSKGVCISSLESLLTTFRDEYEELGYRKLLIQSNTNFQIDRLEDYINSLLGSKYELSLSKLLIDNESVEQHSGSLGQQPQPQIPKQEKTYFCSELIADLYLKFGILSGGKSNNFWPKDFEENEISLSKGFKLSPIMRVQLEEPPQASDISDN